MNIAFAAYFSYIEKFCAYSSVLPCPWGFSGQEPGVGYPVLLQGISPGLNPVLLHSRQILYHLSPHGSPRTMEWVVYPFSRGTSRPRNWTRVSCTAGRFFTSWATWEAQSPLKCESKQILFFSTTVLRKVGQNQLLPKRTRDRYHF